jgi:predicted phosphodiesterase
MHYAGLGRTDDYSTGASKPLVISAIVRAFSDKHKVIQLVEAVLNDKYGLKGNCPPIKEWLERNRHIQETEPKPTPQSPVDDCTRFRIMHLSDFHFSFDEAPTTLRHSLPHLREIEQVLEETKPDIVIVTGDLSAQGDRNSLERAKNWLIANETFNGGSYGLNLSGRLPKIPFVVVAGNSDFTKKPVGGDAESRIDTTLRYFRHLFSDGEVSPGVSYLNDGQEFVFLFKLTIPPNSEECSRESPKNGYSVAEIRDAYRREWKRISKFHSDACRNGVCASEALIATPQQYTRSPKILITHQPLLEGTPSMLESEVKDFLQSLASIGIHVLLCGHQHVHLLEQQPLSKLKKKKDPTRSVHRYLLHSLGINVPLHWFGGDGKRLPLGLGPFIVSLVEQAKSWIVNDSNTDRTDEAVISKCEELLREMLNSQEAQIPMRMIGQLKSQLLESHKDEESVNEVACIEELLKNLNYQQISKLREACKSKPVTEFYREFYKRSVIQCRCGSSGKINGPANRQRNLQVYDIVIFPEHWSMQCTVHPWSNSKYSPDGPPWIANIKR